MNEPVAPARRPMKRTLTLLLCIVGGMATAETWHVNNQQGDDANDGGAPGRSFKTIARAIKSVKLSDTLVLANTGEPYREPISLIRGGGTPAKPFTIEGNGAVISGLRVIPSGDWKRRADGVYEISGPRPYGFPTLLIDGRQSAAGNSEDLQPGQWAWPRKPDSKREGLLRFHPAAGKTPADYRLEATLGVSGLQVNSSSYLVVRNLICEFHANDGFNIHGECRGIVAENIEGRFNGDDGFSIHESIEAVVRNGWFHHNGSGIEDVNLSRSFYSGIRVHDNRNLGVLFIGAFHSAVDALVENNPVNFRISSSVTKHLVGSEQSPIRETSVYLQNVISVGGNVGMTVGGSARVMAVNSIFRLAKTGIEMSGTSQVHLTKSVVADCEKHELNCTGQSFFGDFNIYHPGRFKVAGQEYSADGWDAFRTAVGQHEHAAVKDPALTPSHRIGAESLMKIDGHVIGPTAFYY
jgi:hypothetical protein